MENRKYPDISSKKSENDEREKFIENYTETGKLNSFNIR